MSIPNEALQKLVQEIETQAFQAQREISVVKTAISVKQRDARLLELTTGEVASLPEGTNVYEGVGKMFARKPTADLKRRLVAEAAELKTDIGNLNKKLHYLETTHRNSREHIAQILNSSRPR